MSKPDAPESTPSSSPPPPPPVVSPGLPHGAEAAAADPKHSNHGLMRSAGVVAVMTILSRVLGLWRFRILARMFGASDVADAFNFAFIAPNLTRRLFGEGALTSAFVPVFSEQLAKGQHEAANRTGSILITKVAYWLSLGCVFVIAVAGGLLLLLHHLPASVVAADQIQTIQIKIQLFQWMLPYLIFINVACVLMAVLNSLGHFWMPNFAPVLLNVMIIGACYFVVPYFGAADSDRIWAVAYAVLIGGALQLLIQFPPAFALGFRFRPAVDTSDPGYTEVIANFKPVILLVAVFQANVLLDNIIANAFIAGSGPVTYLNMGTSVYQMVWSIVALALATVSLPALAKFWALSKKEEFYKTLLWGLRMAIFITVPCTIGIMLLSDDIVRLLYGTGRFLENDAEPVRRTAGVALYSSLGLVFFSVNALLARALYAMKDMKTPTTTSAWSVVINVFFNLLFVIGGQALARALQPLALHPDEHQNWVVTTLIDAGYSFGNIREGGIALASTISNGWQTWKLAQAVRAKLGEEQFKPKLGGKTTTEFLKEAGGAGLISVVLGVGVYQYFSHQKDWESFYGFFAAILFSLVPFYLTCREHFKNVLKPETPRESEQSPHDVYGVPENRWTEDQKFQHCIYSTVFATAIMGFVVWAMRDSLPPEGKTFGLVAQRTLVPVAVGVIVYFMAASGMLSREYHEFKAVVWSRLGKKAS